MVQESRDRLLSSKVRETYKTAGARKMLDILLYYFDETMASNSGIIQGKVFFLARTASLYKAFYLNCADIAQLGMT